MIPAATEFEVTSANAAKFDQDLGVYFTLTGEPLRQIPASETPVAGEYTVTAGVYTFAAVDAGKGVLLDYLYTATTGETLDIDNELMGQVPLFGLILTQKFQNKSFLLQLYAATSDKLSMPFKQDDFSVSELTFQAQQNDAGKIGRISRNG
jgi:hypothetical protein